MLYANDGKTKAPKSDHFGAFFSFYVVEHLQASYRLFVAI